VGLLPRTFFADLEMGSMPIALVFVLRPFEQVLKERSVIVAAWPLYTEYRPERDTHPPSLESSRHCSFSDFETELSMKDQSL